jgi:hypothetical protein
MNFTNHGGKLPIGSIWHVRRSLSWINPADLVGLEAVEFEYNLPDATGDAPEWHRKASEQELSVNAVYFRREGSFPATIKLFVKELYRGIPKLYWLTPVVTLTMAQTIAHEVGHHLVAERGYIFEVGEKLTPDGFEEEMAHRYSHHVVKKMRSRWYYRAATWIIRDLASSNYIRGMFAWEKSDYVSAAEYWHRSFHLDPNRDDSIYWYKRAKELLNNRDGTVPQETSFGTKEG